jgi:hypothetical protein
MKRNVETDKIKPTAVKYKVLEAKKSNNQTSCFHEELLIDDNPDKLYNTVTDFTLHSQLDKYEETLQQ